MNQDTSAIIMETLSKAVKPLTEQQLFKRCKLVDFEDFEDCLFVLTTRNNELTAQPEVKHVNLQGVYYFTLPNSSYTYDYASGKFK